MGLFGLAYNGAKTVIGLLTDNSDLVDKGLENGQKSLTTFLYDPVGVTDVIDELSNL